jgi:glucose-1-phosphate thymidylyltransferase
MHIPLLSVQALIPKEMVRTLLILAAGASSRMKQSLIGRSDLTHVPFKSKALIPLGKSKRPAIDYLLDHAEVAGFEQIILVVGNESSAFRAHFGEKNCDNHYRNFNLSYAFQKVPDGRNKPLGTADAIQQTLDQYPHLMDESFVVCNGDNLYSAGALKTLKESPEPNAFISYDRDGLIFTKERILSFALLLQDKDGYLKDIIEKPKAELLDEHRKTFGHLLVSMNLWKFLGKDIYPFLQLTPLHPIRNEKEIPTAALLFTHAKPFTLKGYYRNEHVPDLTSADDIAIVEQHLKINK